jgi:hypothetical protein
LQSTHTDLAIDVVKPIQGVGSRSGYRPEVAYRADYRLNGEPGLEHRKNPTNDL